MEEKKTNRKAMKDFCLGGFLLILLNNYRQHDF